MSGSPRAARGRRSKQAFAHPPFHAGARISPGRFYSTVARASQVDASPGNSRYGLDRGHRSGIGSIRAMAIQWQKRNVFL